MTTTSPSRRAEVPDLLRAEWTKFRTVRGWALAAVVSTLATVLLGLAFAAAATSYCSHGDVEVECPATLLGPDGEPVEDRFYFVHRTLTGDGSITARVTSMNGLITYPPPDHDEIVAGVEPWAKAGVIVKDGTRQGARYASVLVTGQHGVRMQHDFTADTAGGPDGVSPTAPRWLRLTRAGDVLTGAESTDGTHWTTVDTTVLAGLPAAVEIGMFVASPGDLSVEHDVVGGVAAAVRLATVTAAFDQVDVRGSTTAAWRSDDVGAVLEESGQIHHPGSVVESAGRFTVSGHGDIAPLVGGGGSGIESTLVGQLVGLVVLIVAAAQFGAAEYRRGLIRTTLLAEPRRGRVLIAKSAVLGGVGFAAGLLAAAVTVPLGVAILRAGGNQIPPVGALTWLRVVAGTGLLWAAVAVLAGGLGILLRRGVAAVLASVALVVVPYILAVAFALPDATAQWLLRLTPAAGFAIQQSAQEYPQVLARYVPAVGYFPLSPWGGFAVLCGIAALVVWLAAQRLRRGDA
jgi:ABC-2 family transporter protein